MHVHLSNDLLLILVTMKGVMKMNSQTRLPRLVSYVLLVLVFLLISQSVLIAKQPHAPSHSDRIDQLIASGDTYLSTMADVTSLGFAVIPELEAIDQVSLADTNEDTLVQSRAHLLQMAQHNAAAIGSVTTFADAIEAISQTSPAAIDIDQSVNNGLPAEVLQSFVDDLRLSPSQAAMLQESFQKHADSQLRVGAEGLSLNVEQFLLGLGFTQTELDSLAADVAAQGLTNTNLPTRIEQFRATRDELAHTSTRSLVTANQLLYRQVAVRQAQGYASSPIELSEQTKLDSDKRQLLTSIRQIQAAAQHQPQLSAEADHWAVLETQAGHSARQLEQQVLESHHSFLLVDLFLVQQIELLAITARAGEPAYALSKLNSLEALLETSSAASSRGQGETVPGIAPMPRSLTPANDEQQGIIHETNELDNRSSFVTLATGLPNLTANETGELVDIFDAINWSSEDFERFRMGIIAILTGNTEDPTLIAANIAFSMIPVIGVIPDIVTLVTEPGLFIKALSIIGIVGSLDDLLAIIPGAQPVAAISAFGDASSAVLKALVRTAPEVENVLNSLASLRETFDLAIDLVARLIDDLQAAGEQLIDDVTQLTTIIENFLQSSTDLWDSFTSFVLRVGAEQLVELGFTSGSQLVGHVLQRGVTLSDDTIPALVRIGDDLTEADVVLRDEAAEGLARLTDNLGDEGRMRQVLEGAGCILGGVAASSVSESPYIALFNAPTAHAQSADCPDISDILKQVSSSWDQVAFDGWGKLTPFVDEASLGRLLAEYKDNPEDLKTALGHIGNETDDIGTAFGLRNATEVDAFVYLVAQGYDRNRLKAIARVVGAEGSPDIVRRLQLDEGIEQNLLIRSIDQASQQAIRFTVDGGDAFAWTSTFRELDETAFRRLRHLNEQDFRRTTEFADDDQGLRNLQGFLGEEYSRRVFDEIGITRIGEEAAVSDPIDGIGRRLDFVYESDGEIIPVEVKNRATPLRDDQLPDEISKARGAYNRYVAQEGRTMTSYIFHFTHNNFDTAFPENIRELFRNDSILQNVEVIIIHRP